MKIKNILLLGLLMISTISFTQNIQTINKGKYRPSTYRADTDNEAWDKTNENDVALKAAIILNDTEVSIILTNQGTLRDSVIAEMDSTAIHGPKINTNIANIALNTTHRGLIDNPHSVTAAQAEALAVGDTIDGTQVLQLLSDTRSFSITIGAGNDGDTIGFTLNNVIYSYLNDGDHNMVFEKVTGVVYGTSPNVDIALLSDVNFRDGVPVTMLNSDLTIISTTTGSDATSWNDATLAPGEYMWVRIDEATAKPKQLILTFSYYLTE